MTGGSRANFDHTGSLDGAKSVHQRGEQRAAILVSDKLLNEVDELIWPTGGRFSTPSGRRCTFLVVVKTTAQSTPRQ